MKKIITFLITLLLIVSISPIFASAKTINAGIGPNSIFYFFDIAIEKVNLFFTFNPQEKAKLTLEYADERKAELEEIDKEKTPKIYEETVNRYKKQISYAKYVSLDIEEPEKKKEILSLVSQKEKVDFATATKTVTEDDVKTTQEKKTNSVSEVDTKKPITTLMSIGNHGDEVCTLQKILKKENVFDGKVTCYFGTKTHWAVSKLVNKYGYFQTPNNFGKTDKVARDLINKLYKFNNNNEIVKNANVKLNAGSTQRTAKNITSQNKKIKDGVLDLSKYKIKNTSVKNNQNPLNINLNTKIQYTELAKIIKNKYPVYQDIDDEELIIKILKKYPVYKSIVVFEDTIQANNEFLANKNNINTIYTAVENSIRSSKNELYFLDAHVEDLQELLSTIDDCSETNKKLLDSINRTFDNYIAKLKQTYQKDIDSRRAMGFEDSALLTEKELQEKIEEQEELRSIEINKIKNSCFWDDLKSSLQTVLHKTKNDSVYVKTEIDNLYKLQNLIKKSLNSNTISGATINGWVNDLNTINSRIADKVKESNNYYNLSVDRAFSNVSISIDIRNEFNSIISKAEEDYKKWKKQNTPIRCWSDTKYSGGLINGKSETSIRCENGISNPVRCWVTTQYKDGINGTSQTSMRCE